MILTMATKRNCRLYDTVNAQRTRPRCHRRVRNSICFGRKKKSPDQEQQSGDAQGQGQPVDASGSLMEMTMEIGGFSSAPVDASKFEIPAGFKQVEPDAMQHRRR